MFDAIAPRSDLLNRLISLGIDQRWRRRTVDSLGLAPGAHALDVATGTADLAILTALRCPGARVTGLDPSSGMLAVGARKVAARGLEARVTLTEGDAQALPYEPGTFDGATMAFGIRNVPDRPKALRELHRVLRPGARVAILELSEPRTGLLASLARFHIHTVVPWVGSLLSGARAYRYLQESIAAFPPPDAFTALLREAGFQDAAATPLTFGVCCLYVGTKA
ncbi:MAG: bifunctional demethylmenaquinone methyltransferase/2-methoxy-6-polyprenyl-1,4-benzoquinol methylase UbiE [Deltaproteobacteria bacterium]|nr:bifunctional demethylmenaquinone methyltransferase/2-methoxy-6-polyprenyl-1,4-benzoquinol methylase UbiE [Deltaproteobacteria bacterium]